MDVNGVYKPTFVFGVSIHGESPTTVWFMRENPVKRDDLEVPLFQETPICSDE